MYMRAKPVSDDMQGIDTIEAFAPSSPRRAPASKRALDIACILAIMPVVAPVLLMAALTLT